MLITNKNWWYRLLPSILIVLLLPCFFGLPVPAAVHSEGGIVTITEPTGNIKNTVSKETASGPGGSAGNNVTFKDQVPVFLNMNNPDGVTGKEVYAGHTLSGTDGATPADTDSRGFIVVMDEAGIPAPALTADTSDNLLGKSIDITFTDNASWRAAISGVLVDGVALQSGKYTVSAGKISISGSVFQESKEYAIVVAANGYTDASVSQIIGTLIITGDGVTDPQIFTQPQLEAMQPQLEEMEPQHVVYSCINTWPSKKWYVGKGVKLEDLLTQAGLKETAEQIKFSSVDGYYMTLTVKELLTDKRYCFPNFKTGGDGDGHIPGDPSGAFEVETILGLVSAEGTDESSSMNDTNALLLMLGQRSVTEQTGPIFVKYVNKIEVLTAAPAKWDNPTASPDSGIVSAGTMVELHSKYNDLDKVHYTTDGSTPTIESPMYNWIASRWWSSRQDVKDEINHPIEITKNTAIKAIVIGPGKEDSDIVTFEYQVPVIMNTDNLADATENEAYAGHTFTATGGAEPYSFAVTAGTLPAGMVLNGAVLEGTPTESGTFLFTVTLTDSADPADADSHEFTLAVDEAEVVTPVLNADTTDNKVGQPIELTFTDDGLWRSAISGVFVDEVVLQPEEYTVSAGKINIAAGVFTSAKDYSIVVEAEGYEDAAVTQIITTSSTPETKEPPVLTADSSDNLKGRPIELTFTDDGLWRSAISGVLVDEVVLQPEEYTVSAGKINIAAGVFTSAKDYSIVVEAEGYEDAAVTQIITTSSAPETKEPPVLTADNSDNLLGQGIDITFTDDGSWRSAIQEVSVDGAVLQPEKYTVSAGKIAIVSGVFKESKEYAIVVKAGGYPDASVSQTINRLVITGAGVTESKMFTQSQLEAMSQRQYVYSCINTWPSKKWYVGKGVKLSDLLTQAGMKGNAKLIKFSAGDGYAMTLTVQEILTDKRYRFPNFKTGGDGDGHIPGDPSGKVEVETILGLVSAEGTDDPSYMNDTNSLLLMLGQRSVIEQTGPLFVKNVNRIEVLTTTPGKWDTPKVTPSGGEVPVGTMVELHSLFDDMDKVHYTMDGSTPTIESPMYNWIASRWWSSRGEEKVAEINHPLELTKDTVIKAITIGSGKMNSDVVTFSYKVRTSADSKITSGEGGTISLGEEAVLEIPGGALTGSGAREVKIERVETTLSAPKGFKLLGSVYEFSVGGKNSYNFAKKVTIKLSFDAGAVNADETPAIHYYDEAAGEWINLGGEVSGNIITVQVDHFTKFAVIAALPSTVTVKVEPREGGTVSLGEEAVLAIPGGALTGSGAREVKIERVETTLSAPKGFKLLGSVYEFSVGGKNSYNFAKKVTIKLSFDAGAVNADETPAIHYYDEAAGEWINLGGEVSGNIITVQVDHFTKFAVIAALPSTVTAKVEPREGGTVSLGEEAVLAIPEGALTGSEALEVKIERVVVPPAPPAGFKLLSDMFDFSVDGKKWYRFAGEVTIKLSFAPEVRKAEEIPVIYCYDEFSRRWINLGGEINGTTVTVQVDHFTKFAVMAAMEQGLADIAGHWAEYSIKELLTLGAISGYPDGTFKPDKIITRAEFTTVLAKSFQLENRGEKTFIDTEAHWAKNYIAAAVAEGIVNGYDTATFGPDNPVTREQMAVMTVKAAKVSPEAGEPLFDDSGSISAWAGEALVTAMENGLIEEYADNTVRPQNSATRAEAVTVIVNALHKAGERKI